MIDTSRFQDMDEIQDSILFTKEQQKILSDTVDKLLTYKHPLLKKVEFISLWLVLKGLFRLKFIRELKFVYDKVNIVVDLLFEDPYAVIDGIFDAPEFDDHRLLISIIMAGLHALKSILILKLIIEDFESKKK